MICALDLRREGDRTSRYTLLSVVLTKRSYFYENFSCSLSLESPKITRIVLTHFHILLQTPPNTLVVRTFMNHF